MEKNVQDQEQDILELPFTQESIIKSDEQYESPQDVFESQISERISEKGAILSYYPLDKSEDQIDCKPYLLSLLGNDTTACHSVKDVDEGEHRLFLLSKLGDASSDLSAKKSCPAILPNNSLQAKDLSERKNNAEKLSNSSITYETNENCISRVDYGEGYQKNAILDIKIGVNETQIDQASTKMPDLFQYQQQKSSFKTEQYIPRRYVVIPEDQRVLLDSNDAWYDPDAVHKTQYANIPQQVCNILASNLPLEQKFSRETMNHSLCEWIDQERRQSKSRQYDRCDESKRSLWRSQSIPRRFFLIPNDQKALLRSSDAWYDSSTNLSIERARMPPSVFE